MSNFNLITKNQVVSIEIHDFPVDKESFFEMAIRSLAIMIPTWVHQLTIWNCTGRQTDNAADASCRFEYHMVDIHIFDSFWNATRKEVDWFLILKHEMAHVLTAPLFHAAVDSLDCAFPNDNDRGPGYKHMQKTIKDQWEFVTSDLERNFPVELEKV